MRSRTLHVLFSHRYRFTSCLVHVSAAKRSACSALTVTNSCPPAPQRYSELFEPREERWSTMRSSMFSGDPIATMLCGDSHANTVTASLPGGQPRSTCSGSQGLPSSSSATQNVHSPGWDNV